ncbi:MAG: T9SS type B sorting domain-containing protein [Maribacter sp.]
MKTELKVSMAKVWVVIPCILIFLMSTSPSFAQSCPQLLSPANGANSVPVSTSIQWENITGVPGYLISIGTTPGGRDILSEQNIGSSNTYSPPLGLPESTEVFITITLFFFNQPNIVCDSQRFTTAALTAAPACTSIRNPLDGDENVNTATNLFWNSAPNATGYFLTIGTSLNGGEIVDNIDIGNQLQYDPILDFPAETDIYVTIIPYNRIGTATNCTTSVFRTVEAVILPGCSALITPFDGETNVPLSPVLEWNAVPNATGYRVSIGNTPFDANILEDAIFSRTSTSVIDFEANRTFFITIIPFNSAGEAIGCSQETFSTLLGCGPYFDPLTGELRVLNPVISFPEIVNICSDRDSNIVSATDEADGHRWYKINGIGNDQLISSASEVTLTESGTYRYEAFTIIENDGNTIECPSFQNFQVEISEAPKINSVNVQQQGNFLTLEVQVSGTGNYEYAIDDENGPYQDSNRFTGVSKENHTVFVRDKKGCGAAQERVEIDLTLEGFPLFFTPNGDNTNDFWQFLSTTDTAENEVLSIRIFDRFGTLLAQIDPNSQGWNGVYNGQQLPEADYWFRAVTRSNKILKGHFSLKR